MDFTHHERHPQCVHASDLGIGLLRNGEIGCEGEERAIHLPASNIIVVLDVCVEGEAELLLRHPYLGVPMVDLDLC